MILDVVYIIFWNFVSVSQTVYSAEPVKVTWWFQNLWKVVRGTPHLLTLLSKIGHFCQVLGVISFMNYHSWRVELKSTFDFSFISGIYLEISMLSHFNPNAPRNYCVCRLVRRETDPLRKCKSLFKRNFPLISA